MQFSKYILAAALAVSTVAFTMPAETFAAQKKAAAQSASWDGTWSGKWGGKAMGQVKVKGNKVTAYYFRGKAQNVGATIVSGNKLTFGSDYKVTLTMTGEKTASAFYRGRGTAKADMSR